MKLGCVPLYYFGNSLSRLAFSTSHTSLANFHYLVFAWNTEAILLSISICLEKWSFAISRSYRSDEFVLT